MDLKQAAISTCTIVFVLSSMLGLGLGLRVSEIVAPLRNWRLVTLSLVANFVVMPAVAVALARLLRLDEALGVGACCSSARRAARRSFPNSHRWHEATSRSPWDSWSCSW